jgi:hypothetical protein
MSQLDLFYILPPEVSMKAQIASVQIDSLVPFLALSAEYPTLDSAYEVIKPLIPSERKYVPVDLKLVIAWGDKDKITVKMKLSYAMEEAHAHPRQGIFKHMGFFAGICQPQNMTADVYQVNMSLNAVDGDVDGLNQACIKWIVSHDIGYGDDYGREITSEELADLSDYWENTQVDHSKYTDCVIEAWEVRDWLYEKYKAVGGLCQQANGKYYIA